MDRTSRGDAPIVELHPNGAAAELTVRTLLKVAEETAPHWLSVVWPLDTRTTVLLGGWEEQETAVGQVLERLGWGRIPRGEFVYRGWQLRDSRVVFDSRVCAIQPLRAFRFEGLVGWLHTA